MLGALGRWGAFYYWIDICVRTRDVSDGLAGCVEDARVRAANLRRETVVVCF